MHAVFAIEPEAVNNWHDLRYALEKFGYSKGLLVARFPSRWMAMVMEACRKNGLGEMELKRIEEKLRLAKDDRIVRIGLPFEGADWLNNAESEFVRGVLYGVLVQNKVEDDFFHCLADVNEDLFNNHNEMRVKRSACALAEAARYVMFSSQRIALVDPYFEARLRCCKVLRAMIDLCRKSGHGLAEITVYTAQSTGRRSLSHDANTYNKLLADWLRDDIKLRVVLLPAESMDEDFHARYLFNQRAGLRFDRGFVEPEDHDQREHLTDVVCLSDARVEELNSRYLDEASLISGAETIFLPLVD